MNDKKLTYQRLQLFSSSIFRHHPVVAFDHIEIIIPRMSDKLARRVREWYRVLLQLRAQFWNLENATTQNVNSENEHRKLIGKTPHTEEHSQRCRSALPD